jgi:hypothetical protein
MRNELITETDPEMQPVYTTLYVKLKGLKGTIVVPFVVDFKCDYSTIMAKKALEIGRSGVFDKSQVMVVYHPPREIDSIEYQKEL